MRRGTGGLLTAMLMASVVGLGAPARAAEAPLMARVSFRNVEQMVERIATLVDKMAPGQGDLVRNQAAQFLQMARMAGVDVTRPITIAVFSGKGGMNVAPLVSGILPLSAQATFEAFNQPGNPLLRGKQATIRNGFAIVSRDARGLEAVTDARLASYSRMPKFAGDRDIYATLYIADSLTEYQADIDAFLANMRPMIGLMVGGMGAMPGEPGAQPGMGGAALKAFDCVSPLLKLTAKQARRLSLTVAFRDRDVEVRGRLYAVPGSELNSFFEAQPGKLTDVVKYLPADAVACFAGHLGMAAFRPLFESALKAVAGPVQMTAQTQQKLLDLAFGSGQTGEFGVAVPGGPKGKGMQTVQVTRVEDGGKFRTATRDYLSWFNQSGLGKLMQGLGMKMTMDMQPGHRQYKGTAVDRIVTTVEMAAPGVPQPPPEVSEIAAVGTFGVVSSGDETGGLLNAVVDRIKGGGTPGLQTSKDYRAAQAAAPPDANLLFHVSLSGLAAKFAEQMAKQPMGPGAALGDLFKHDPNEEPVVGYGRFAKRRTGASVDFAVRVPHAPLASLISRAMTMGGPPGVGPVRVVPQQPRRPEPQF